MPTPEQFPILTDERQVGRSPFTLMIGLKFVQCQGPVAYFAVESAPELLDVHESFHGGVIMSLLDAGMATAALSSIGFTQVVVTLAMSVSFLRPASGKLTSFGQVTGRAGSVCHCEGKVTNEAGEIVATGIGSFKFQTKTVPSDDVARA